MGPSQTITFRTVSDRTEARLPYPAMTRSPQPFNRIVDADATLAAWAARRGNEESLTGIVRRLLPRPLATRIHVADARTGQLEIAADAGAVAAIVRQRNVELLAALKREGFEFTGIRVRVQVRIDPPRKKKPLANPLDRSSLRPLSALARDLPAGPLKAALERFLRRTT